MYDPLYLQQGKHSCMIIYICNKWDTYVCSSISATRRALLYDPLYLQQGDHSCKILYIVCTFPGHTHLFYLFHENDNIQLMHPFEANIRIFQPENSEHRF